MQVDTFNQITKNLSQVHIDDEGKFKYILIKLSNKDGQEYYFVRGLKKYEFHAQNFEHFCKEAQENIKWTSFTFDIEEGEIKAVLNDQKFKFKCVGGGRIEHSNKAQTLSIYGYSQSYGQCDHLTSLHVIRTVYQYLDKNVSTSNDGY